VISPLIAVTKERAQGLTQSDHTRRQECRRGLGRPSVTASPWPSWAAYGDASKCCQYEIFVEISGWRAQLPPPRACRLHRAVLTQKCVSLRRRPD